ncbi:MAG: hypothetical protein AAF991_02910 [Pseudomonadota bacterium]
MAQALYIAAASIFGLLGFLHLVYTLFSDKFHAYDPAVNEAMESSSLILSRDINMWRAWIGFNASHSVGAIMIAAIYVPLALNHLDLLKTSVWFSVFPAVLGVCYVVLARLYWFRFPFLGISVATVLFIWAAVLIRS